MNIKQLMFLLHLWKTDVQLKTIHVRDSGCLEVMFIDSGGNYHHQMYNTNGTVTTLE